MGVTAAADHNDMARNRRYAYSTQLNTVKQNPNLSKVKDTKRYFFKYVDILLYVK
jgi:hypothetical protein